MMTVDEEIREFEQITKHMLEVYRRKHHDYGQSTKDTYRKYGPVSMAVRMRDKLNRFETLIELEKRGDQIMVNESLFDTLLDLANYAIITMIEQKDLMNDNNTSKCSC